MPTVLREVGREAVDTLLAIIHAAFEEYRGVIDPPSSAPDETRERLLAVMDVATAVLAEVDGHPAGCVFYQPADHDGGVYLFRLAVLPEFRRQGVARGLIEHVERRARASGFPRVTLGTRVALPANQRYYERLGYRVIRQQTHPGYTTPTYTILAKDLSK